MTLLSVVKEVCAVVGVVQPTSVFSGIANNRTMAEMLALANEMAQRIAYDTREWTALQLQATFTGDGVTEAFAMPANYKRMLKTANVWRSTQTQFPMRFIADYDMWLQRRTAGYVDYRGEWIIAGERMHIWPIMGVGVTAKFPYLDCNPIALAGGGNGFTFMADGDTFRLGDRILKLGMIWQWKANKGSPYAEDLGNYSVAIDTVAGADKPAPIYIGRQPISLAARVAYPWPVPTP